PDLIAGVAVRARQANVRPAPGDIAPPCAKARSPSLTGVCPQVCGTLKIRALKGVLDTARSRQPVSNLHWMGIFGLLAMKRILAFLFLAGQTSSAGLAQTAASEPLRIGDVTVSGSLRTRVESWDWFQGSASNQYTFPGSIARIGLSESTRKLDWQIEFAAPFLLGLPGDAVAAGAQGQQGFGAGYYV